MRLSTFLLDGAVSFYVFSRAKTTQNVTAAIRQVLECFDVQPWLVKRPVEPHGWSAETRPFFIYYCGNSEAREWGKPRYVIIQSTVTGLELV